MIRGRLTKRLVALGVVAAGAVIADRAGILTAAGADVWNYPALEEELARHVVERAEIDPEARAVMDQRIAAKDKLVADLVAGRTTLEAVADTFRELNRNHPETLDVLERTYHTDDPQETAARNVLDFVASASYPSPAAREATLARLRAEFVALFPHAAPVP